jgi:acetyl esterase
MKTDLFTYPRFIILFLRLKLLNLTSRFPPLSGGVLDEQTALMRRAQLVLGEMPLDQTSPAQARLNFRKSFSLLKSIGGIFEKVDSVRELTIPGPAGEIPARLYLPGKGTAYPLFVFLHGGGWVIGDLDSADNMARFLCGHVNCVVLSVDYRLAPEHIFPAAVDDSFAAVQWAVAHAGELGGDPKRVLVGGDSAGGNLTAVVAQMARQKGAPRLAGQVLFYAATDGASLDTPSYKEFGDKSLGLPTRDVEWFLEQYTPNPKDRLNPLVSPLLADDLRELPPALVVTAEFDVLRDEGEAYARRMQEAGVKVQLMRCNGMVHGFLSTIGLIMRATQYFEQVAAEIRKMAANPPASFEPAGGY